MSYENFAYYYDSLMDQSFYDDYLDFICKHVHFHNVFELGCGTGEMAIRLAEMGKAVVATDLSDDMLEVARNKAMYHDVDVQFAKVDMCDFEIDSEIDLILCLCDSLNYILKEEDIVKVFMNAFHGLKNTGTFIFDVNSLYKMNTVLDGYEEESDDPDYYFHWQTAKIGPGFIRHIVEINDKVENEYTFEEHLQQTFAVDFYIELLKKAGFGHIEIYSDFHDYDKKCERVIFICRKEG